MNKTAIKNFATWARRKLISEITYKAGLIGVSDKGISEALSISTDNIQFYNIGTGRPAEISDHEIKQRDALVSKIKEKESTSDYKTAFQFVIEEVAYTWFNRLIAIRFMEVNDYLPSRIRVISSTIQGKIEPDMVTTPFDTDLVFSAYEKDRIMQLKHENEMNELFRMLFIKQCNKLNEVLPKLFEKTADYSELLLTLSSTDSDGIVSHLVNDIVEDDFAEAVEIIGWLYQYYNAEPKDEVFQLLKKNVKITKERIPAATQLFTPDWIVRYMVENSLGRLWIEGHPSASLKSEWKYYLEEAEQEDIIKLEQEKIRTDYKKLSPEGIKIIDPCMGSGHILVYAFDVLMQIYESQGYTKRDASNAIIENNLYGLDIDDRAYQLAYFAVMMKARKYDRRFLTRGIEPKLYSVKESNGINKSYLQYFGCSLSSIERKIAIQQMEDLLNIYRDAKEYGSILKIDDFNWDLLNSFVCDFSVDGQLTIDSFDAVQSQAVLKELVSIGKAMEQKYDVVVTNPPYMGNGGMGTQLSDFVKKNYPDTKSDMSTVCMEKALDMCKKTGIMAMINIPVWMFLSSYEKLRENIISQNTIVNMIHFGRGVFGSDFGTTAFVISRSKTDGYNAIYRKLYMKQGAVDSVEEKERMFFDGVGYYNTKQENFIRIPGQPIAYWISDRAIQNFSVGVSVDAISDFTGSQHKTADNEKYLRFFWEVCANKIINKEWILYIKGGEFRKWYGNIELVVDWRTEALTFYKTNTTSNMIKDKYFFAEGITYTSLSSASNGFRYLPPYGVFDIKGPSFVKVSHLNYCLGFFNSKVANMYLKLLNPTITLQVKDVKNTPLIINEQMEPFVDEIVSQNISISKTDWDSFETSWDFNKHPLCQQNPNGGKIEDVCRSRQKFLESQFKQMKCNEEELNRIFIEIYGLQEELETAIEDKAVTICKFDLISEVKSLVSYAVGCMFGRYSLDANGIFYSGAEWDASKYGTFIPDKDNCILITDEEYFGDDIVCRFVEFIKCVYGAEMIEENLDFIAKALDNKGESSRAIIRNYFVKDFYKDHLKTYQKRPIYWLYDSGKQDGFKALVYMHRYTADTTGIVRVEYLHKMQKIYMSEINRMKDMAENGNNVREVAQAEKRREKIIKQLKETKEYDEKIAHLALSRIAIDLDDGVKVNYEKVQTGQDGKTLEILGKI